MKNKIPINLYNQRKCIPNRTSVQSPRTKNPPRSLHSTPINHHSTSSSPDLHPKYIIFQTRVSILLPLSRCITSAGARRLRPRQPLIAIRHARRTITRGLRRIYSSAIRNTVRSRFYTEAALEWPYQRASAGARILVGARFEGAGGIVELVVFWRCWWWNHKAGRSYRICLGDCKDENVFFYGFRQLCIIDEICYYSDHVFVNRTTK